MKQERTQLMVVSLMLTIMLILISLSPASAQQKFPTRPINFYVAAPPGGYFDLTSRPMAEYATKALGQPMVCINKPGAATTLAATVVKSTPPDGYNLAQITTSLYTLPPQQDVNYDPVKDFTYICSTFRGLGGIAVRADAPWNTLDDLIAYAKANPGKVKYGTANPRGNLHFIMIEIGMKHNLQWEMVPYLSGNEVTAAVMGGHIQALSSGPEWVPLVEAGKLKVLAVVSDKRSKRFASTPSTVELGYTNWDNSIGIVGPAGMPKQIVDILDKTFKDSLTQPQSAKMADMLNATVSYRNHDEYTKFSLDSIAHYKKFLTQIGMAKK